jgi:uncharacterized protein (DUF885 family)
MRAFPLQLLLLCVSVLMGCGAREVIMPMRASFVRDTVNAVAEDFWEWQLHENPEDATSQGDHRFDDRLTDLSPAAFARRAAKAEELGRRLDAIGPTGGEDAITTDVLRLQLDQVVESARLHTERLAIDQLDGPQSGFPRLMANHPRRDAHDIDTLLARYRAFPAYLEQYRANLRAGLVEKRTAPRVLVDRVIHQLHDLLAVPPDQSRFARAATDVPSLPDATRERLRASLIEATSQLLYPAYSALLDFLEKEYLPAARTDVGLWAIPGGAELYALAIRQRTTTRLTPAELHRLGETELARIEGEMAPIAARLGLPADPRDAEERLRRDAEGRFTTRAALLAEYRRDIDRFWARMPEEFSRLPQGEPRVEPMAEFMEKHAPAAYYDHPSEDGTRPGTLHVNTWQPETKPAFKIETLAAHEGVPGHHLQITTALALQGLPRVRRDAGITAFTEGWATYAERLADEMGLYSDDRARFGMLSTQAFRAARLVVDTGMHAMKWTREQAIDFMLAHSAASRQEVEVEIDRYIAWPAQGMAYTLGELEIFAARADAQQVLGPRFSRRAFHDRLLASGAIPLETMRRVMAAWARRPATGT